MDFNEFNNNQNQRESEKSQEAFQNENMTYGQSFIMYGEEPKTESKKKRPAGKKVAAVVLVVAISAGAGFGGGLAGSYFGNRIFVNGNVSGSNLVINPSDQLNTAEVIAKKVMPSVVGISTKTNVTYQSWFGRQTGVSEGVGTGIIVDENGYIITNSHVISDGEVDTIQVQLNDGRECEGSVLWCDKTLDLAIVKIDEKGLQAAELGDSEDVNIGAYAVAIGNPLGMAFQRSLTQGVISGLDRSISVSEGQSVTTMDGLMQTDASINSGNSGGPLLNSKGQVIGINTAKVDSSKAESLGFAIPINTAKPIIEEIKEKGEFTRAYIGISGVSVSTLLESYPNVDLGTETGVYVADITAGGGAEAAGIRKEDVIIEVDGNKVDSMSRLNTKLIEYRPGDKVTLTILREGKEMKIDVKLQAGASI